MRKICKWLLPFFLSLFAVACSTNLNDKTAIKINLPYYNSNQNAGRYTTEDGISLFFDLAFTSESNEVIKCTGESGDKVVVEDLEQGLYKIDCTAYFLEDENREEPVFKGETEVTVIPGKTVEAKVVLKIYNPSEIPDDPDEPDDPVSEITETEVNLSAELKYNESDEPESINVSWVNPANYDEAKLEVLKTKDSETITIISETISGEMSSYQVSNIEYDTSYEIVLTYKLNEKSYVFKKEIGGINKTEKEIPAVSNIQAAVDNKSIKVTWDKYTDSYISVTVGILKASENVSEYITDGIFDNTKFTDYATIPAASDSGVWTTSKNPSAGEYIALIYVTTNDGNSVISVSNTVTISTSSGGSSETVSVPSNSELCLILGEDIPSDTTFSVVKNNKVVTVSSSQFNSDGYKIKENSYGLNVPILDSNDVIAGYVPVKFRMPEYTFAASYYYNSEEISNDIIDDTVENLKYLTDSRTLSVKWKSTTYNYYPNPDGLAQIVDVTNQGQTVSYTWYKNNTADNSNTTSNSCTVATETEAGAYEYYCKIEYALNVNGVNYCADESVDTVKYIAKVCTWSISAYLDGTEVSLGSESLKAGNTYNFKLINDGLKDGETVSGFAWNYGSDPYCPYAKTDSDLICKVVIPDTVTVTEIYEIYATYMGKTVAKVDFEVEESSSSEIPDLNTLSGYSPECTAGNYLINDLTSFASLSSDSETKDFEGYNFYFDSDLELTETYSKSVFASNKTVPFKGKVYGLGHIIKNLNITNSGSEVSTALFGWLGSGALIKGLNVEDASITSSTNKAAIIAGTIVGDAVIDGCTVSGSVTATNQGVGGICAVVETTLDKNNEVQIAEIRNCINKAALQGSDYVGGLVGLAGFSSTSDLGKAGTSQPKVYIINCYNTGSIKATDSSSLSGGIIGGFYGSDYSTLQYLVNCYNAGSNLNSNSSFGSISGGNNDSNKDYLNVIVNFGYYSSASSVYLIGNSLSNPSNIVNLYGKTYSEYAQSANDYLKNLFANPSIYKTWSTTKYETIDGVNYPTFE